MGSLSSLETGEFVGDKDTFVPSRMLAERVAGFLADVIETSRKSVGRNPALDLAKTCNRPAIDPLNGAGTAAPQDLEIKMAKEATQTFRQRIEKHKRHVAFAVTIGVVVGFLALTDGGRDASRAEALTAASLLEDVMVGDEGALPPEVLPAWAKVHALLVATGVAEPLGMSDPRLPVSVKVDAGPVTRTALENRLRSLGLRAVESPHLAMATLKMKTGEGPDGKLGLGVLYKGPSLDGGERQASGDGLPGHWWSILPPLLAILIAFFYGRALLALGAAVLLGSALVNGSNPVVIVYEALATYVGGALSDSFKLYVLGFTVALVGMVQVAARSGGNQGLIDAVGRFAKTARSTRIATVAMGLIIFFDDYANTLVVGTSARPMTDRMKISREKLAYIVDSTAAPVAGLAIISTWVGYEVGLFQGLSDDLSLGKSGFELLLLVLPSRFYCILALVFVSVGALVSRDYGPMLEAERRATLGVPPRGGRRERAANAHLEKVSHKKGAPARWYNSGVPILVTLCAVIAGIAIDGGSVLSAAEAPAPLLSTFDGWRAVFAEADSGKVLFVASLIGSVVAIALATGQRILSVKEALKAWSAGARIMGVAMAILVLAWCIQAVTEDLGTSAYLVSVLEPVILPALLPLLVFILAAAVAFSTGTSWGTMGILLPALIPMAWVMTGDLTLTLLCMGGVLDGAIFGDHCSPISDTTVMSSIASGCDHIQHVRTQMPYALTVMGLAAVLGYGIVP
ncbi:MAG: hypothetical protein COW42_02560, partial [Deltaproteobacteria bacterium CG17_big_fil_post_rev_8_21_14_2_50_63_7]